MIRIVVLKNVTYMWYQMINSKQTLIRGFSGTFYMAKTEPLNPLMASGMYEREVEIIYK